jgi:hypothetical protein
MVSDTATDTPSPPVQQLDLLAEPGVLSRQQGSAPAAERRGRGRPKGAKNRRSQEWVQYILALYPSPVESMAAVGAMQPEELLLAIGIRPTGWIEPSGHVRKVRSVREMVAKGVKPVRVEAGWRPVYENADLKWAFEKIQQAQAGAAPYLHEKRGAVVEDSEGNDVPALVYGVILRPGGAAPDMGHGGLTIDATPRNLRPKPLQALSGPDDVASTADASTDDAKSLIDNEK